VRSVEVLVGAWLAGGHGWPSYQGRVGDMATAQQGYHCSIHRSCLQVPLLEEREGVVRPGRQRITKFEHVLIHSLPPECSRRPDSLHLGKGKSTMLSLVNWGLNTHHMWPHARNHLLTMQLLSKSAPWGASTRRLDIIESPKA
jgi:hypothetical protein